MQQLDRGRQSREGAARTSAPPRGGGGHPSVRRSGGGWALRCRLWRSVLARGPAVAVWGQPEGRGGRLGQREEQGATAGEGGAGPPWESLALRMRRLSTCAPVRRYNLLQRLGTPEVGAPPPFRGTDCLNCRSRTDQMTQVPSTKSPPPHLPRL